jgi:hypothetical protein
MSFRSSRPAQRPVTVALCLMLACVGVAVIAVATADAAQYKMLLCAGNNGSNNYVTATNTTSPQNPGGIFSFENYCGPAPDPAGDRAFLRIAENQSGGNAGQWAYGSIYYDVPPHIQFKTAGGYTRQPNAFNQGWRARFWAIDYNNNSVEFLNQGIGAPTGITGTFAPHLWSPPGIAFWRFVMEMQCVRPEGCDRANFNAFDANSFVFILSDEQDARISITNGSPLMAGAWVRGTNDVTWDAFESGSGIRFERVRVDGNLRFQLDHRGSCDLDYSLSNGEFARRFSPCVTGEFRGRSWPLDTRTLPDGQRNLTVCGQDYAQAVGWAGTGSERCELRFIRVDNTPPGAPSGLQIISPNPQRYLDRFDASFSLPPNQGSPIAKVHYEIVDAAGKVVVPQKVISKTNPTSLGGIEGPKAAGAYRLRLWLEDSVGFTGPATTAPIPHDTTPPAAPQDVSVTAPSVSRATQGIDVRWRNITDAGAPIDAVHYQVLNPNGEVTVPTRTLGGESPQTIENMDTPRERGSYTLRLWLSDAEGNAGAPVKAPLAYECVRSEVAGGSALSAGLGERAEDSIVVPQDSGASLRGRLSGHAGPKANAPLCVFSNVVTDQDRQFLGIAMTNPGGDFKFALAAGPSRHISVVYRPDQRELSANVTLRTRVRPSFNVRRRVIRNKTFAVFSGGLPGPHNEDVVVVLQVKSGKAWRVFRRYRTREGGRFVMRYRFTQTTTPTTYIMRAQVPTQSGYAFEQGNSRVIPLRVMP